MHYQMMNSRTAVRWIFPYAQPAGDFAAADMVRGSLAERRPPMGEEGKPMTLSEFLTEDRRKDISLLLRRWGTAIA